MSQIDDIKANAREIHKALRRLAPSTREAVMPVHTIRDMLDELERKAGELEEQVESLD